MKKIKLLLVDDHKVVREGIKNMIHIQKKFICDFHEAENGIEAVNKAKVFNYDLILMDYKMPEMNGVDATREILQNDPENKILILSMFDDEIYVKAMIKAGAMGYVLKNAGSEEINKAISTVLKGKPFYSSEVAMALLKSYDDILSNNVKGPDNVNDPSVPDLTPRQIEILTLISKGYTNDDIGEHLKIHRRTVEAHRKNIRIKANVSTMAEAVALATKYKLIK